MRLKMRDRAAKTFTGFYLANRHELDAVLFDIDGTLSAGGKALPGAAELLEQMSADDFPYLLLTNDSFNACTQKVKILSKAGLCVPEEKIFSAGDVLTKWASGGNCNGELFFQCGHLGEPSFALKANMKTTSDCDAVEQCKGVLIGEGSFDWHRHIEAVFNFFLKYPDAPLVAANPDSYWPSCQRDGMGIGAGGIARFVCSLLADAGIEKSPIYLGKPYAPIYECAYQRLSSLFPERDFSTPRRIAAVGDSLGSDIKGGNANGLLSCLVLTGITSAKMAANASPERPPAMIFESV